jgi:hypothetical protein
VNGAKNKKKRKPRKMNMKWLIITQEYLFLFSAANAGRMRNGWKSEKKLQIMPEFHLLKDLRFM